MTNYLPSKISEWLMGRGVSVARMMERSVGDWNCNGDMGERISSLPYFKELEMLASVLRFLS